MTDSLDLDLLTLSSFLAPFLLPLLTSSCQILDSKGAQWEDLLTDLVGIYLSISARLDKKYKCAIQVA